MTAEASASEERSGCQTIQPAISAAAASPTAPPIAQRATPWAGRARPARRACRPAPASGPRAATQPAQTSAGTAAPGMNQVQSMAECTPKATATASTRHAGRAPSPLGDPPGGPAPRSVRRTASTQLTSSTALTISPIAPKSAKV